MSILQRNLKKYKMERKDIGVYRPVVKMAYLIRPILICYPTRLSCYFYWSLLFSFLLQNAEDKADFECQNKPA